MTDKIIIEHVKQDPWAPGGRVNVHALIRALQTLLERIERLEHRVKALEDPEEDET